MNVLDAVKKEIAGEITKNLKESITIDELSYPPEAKMGDLTFSCFNVAKALEKNPAEVAKELSGNIQKGKYISEIKSFGPYVNFFLSPDILTKKVLKEIRKRDKKYGQGKELRRKKIMVEFAHPNPFKSFHIGHLRNIFLGESIVRILESQEAKVIRTNYQGDVGMHIAKCLWSFKKIDEKDYPNDNTGKVALLGKCYAEGAKVFDEDEKIKEEIKDINEKIYSGKDEHITKLWNRGKKWSLDKFKDIYTRVYSHFDREYMESEVMDDCLKYVSKAKEMGILEESQGAVIFPGEKHGLDTRVFLNSQGLPTYDGKELGLAYREFSDFGKIDLCIHNVAIEQISFFKVNFKVQELLDEKKFKGKQYHNAYEFVGLKSGKMSSRKGQVVLGEYILNDANKKIGNLMKEKGELENTEDIVEKVSVGAVKYAFLKISPFKYLAFDLKASISFSGDSGPYLQYTYARIQSILKKVGYNRRNKYNSDNLQEEKEHALIIKLAKYPEIVRIAAKEYDPSEIARYIYELTKMFNDYYHDISIIKSAENIKLARLGLISSIAQVIESGLDLLGIKVVDKM